MPNKSVRYSSSFACVCCRVKKKKSMAYSFLFGDSKGDKKKPYWLLSGVCRPRPVIFKSLHPLLLLSNPPPPITSLHFFSRWFFFFHLGIFFSPLYLHFYFTPALLKPPVADVPSGPVTRGREKMKENYRPIRQSLYKYFFFTLFLVRFSFSSYSPLFFSNCRLK